MGARRWLTALTVASMAIVLPAASIAPSSAAAARGRKALPGTVPSWAKASRARGEATGPVALTVALRWRNGGQLADVDRAVSDPRSPDYKHYLSAEAFRHRFSPSRASVAAVKRYLRRKGLRVNGVSKSRMLIEAVGSTRDAERAFHTKLREFRHARRTLRAPATPVSLPKSLAGSVASVVGLDQTMFRPLAASGLGAAAGVREREALLPLLGKGARHQADRARLLARYSHGSSAGMSRTSSRAPTGSTA